MPLEEARKGDSVGFHVYPRVSREWTIGEPEKVTWGSIRHLCSKDVAVQVASSVYGYKDKRDREAIAKNLKLYIQQASEFYDIAKEAKANTAPLVYYYSFLNMAKATCELKVPKFHQHKECYRHGISWRPKRIGFADPGADFVSTTEQRGVWHVLWESTTGTAYPATGPAKLPIKQLFSYCQDVGVEFQAAFGNRMRSLLHTEALDILYDGATAEAWLTFSIERFWLRMLRIPATKLLDELKTHRSGYTEVKSSNPDVRTFQSSVAKKVEAYESSAMALRTDVVGLNVFAHPGEEKNLMYLFPIQFRLPVRMSQLMVHYTILFWLGSLVRYDPHSVDALIDSNYWILIDGFMNQSRIWLLELFEWHFYQAETTLCSSR